MKFLNLNIINRLVGFTAILSMLFSLSACRDELLYDPSYIGEGEADINAELTIFQLTGNLDTRAEGDENPVTGGTPGNAIGAINELVVLAYDLEGKLVDSFSGKELIGFTDPNNTIENKDTSSDAIPSDSEGNKPHQAEESTVTKKFQLKNLPYGKYHMYAVANMGDLSDYAEDIKTEDGLKNIVLKWNEDNIASNNQMFGYFTTENKSSGFGPEEVIVNNRSVNIRAWMKRVVSKVTVAFDGSNLNDGVEIFIKSVEIRDIPNEVYLGADNKISDSDNLIDKNQEMLYGKDSEYTANWIGYVSKEHPINGYNQAIVNNTELSNDEKLAALHSEDTNAFFFFENMQGKGREGTPSDKRQQVKETHVGVVSYPNGSDPNDVAWKDAKKYGSYIVVRAYYKSPVESGEGEGEILYRFMLGKDIKLDYDAERNYHYKLTLCFNKWANDVDWHIDYRKDSDKDKLRIPNPFYISYLYGQSGMMPIEFDADEDVKIKQIEVEITSNSWGPDTEGSEQAEYPCNKTALELYNYSASYYGDYWLYLQPMDKPETYPWNGFLSVRKPENLILVTGEKPFTVNSNYDHYINSGQNKRIYPDKSLNESLEISNYPVYRAETEDKPHVAWEDGTYYVKLPIWTRARLLIKETGYTGNNPYTSYFRLAKMKVKVTLQYPNNTEKVIDTLTDSEGNVVDEVTIQQVRRVVNPKGVWRTGGSKEEFNVTLMALKSEDANAFEEIKSDGPWRAYVLHDTRANSKDGSGGFIKLSGQKGDATTEATTTFEFNDTESTEIVTRDCIEGIGNSNISFKINFDGTVTNEDPQYALIRVEYNNYTCYHLIYVRQGYGEDDVFDDGNVWMTFNNISKNELAKDPRDEGSLFKFGSWDGIPASFNQNNKPWKEWTKVTPDFFLDNAVKDKIPVTSGGEPIAYSSIAQNKSGFNVTDNQPTGMRVAEYEDFFGKLAPEEEDNQGFPIKTGVGVLYADGATTTKKALKDAYGYIAGQEGCKTRGMRGVFVYDVRNGRNLFFPIGNSGYGHRKNGFLWGGPSQTVTGVLRYSSQNRWGYFNIEPTSGDNTTYPNGAYDAPLFLDIFRSEGAIYYLGKPHGSETSEKAEKPIGWDMNYRTLNFEAITTENVGYGEDACFVRCIKN